jgi:urease accessory protein
VIACTTAVVEPGGVLGPVACAPPLTLRQVHGEDAGRCELRLVGSAAGPLAGDDLSLFLRLRPSARRRGSRHARAGRAVRSRLG